MVEVIRVKTSAQKKRFIDFPHHLFKNDPNYVPELYSGQKELLTPGKHPFYEHSSGQLFLAYKKGEIVGRIAAFWNTNNNKFNHTKEGHFGFFDSEDDQEAANALLDSAFEWCKGKGAEKMVGPINLTTNDSCGLLVDGFDLPPVVMMPYNPPYYSSLIEGYGLHKMTDLRAYIVRKDKASMRSVQLLERLETRLKRSNITLRQIDLKNFKRDAESVKQVYNKAWDENLGFVPMTDAEFAYATKEMKMILDPKYAILAEKDGEVIGFALGIPNINEILINIKKGRLFPTGIFKLLFGLKKVKSIRVLMLGVLEKYRKLGIEACLYGRIIKNAIPSGIERAECSWMLDDNYLMNHAIEQINADFYKRYRLYEKEI